jgi:TRAP-type uncharacterized transport system fused permease subunit
MAEGPSKFRTLTGAARAAERSLLSGLTLIGAAWALEVHHAFPWTFFKEQYLGLFLALALGAVFLSVKPHVRAPGHWVPWYDCLFSLSGLAAGGYIVVF